MKRVEISRMICFGILAGMSILDIASRKVPVKVLLVMALGAVGYHAVCREEEILVLAAGAAVGILFVFMSRVTKEGIGYGDSLGIFALGVYLGVWSLLEVLSGAFFLLAISAAALLAGKRMSRKYALPFYPFLTIGYALWMIGGAACGTVING